MQSLRDIQLPPELGMRSAGTVRAMVLDALENTDVLILDIPDDAEIDLSFLQLLQSARVTVDQQNKSLALKSPLNERHLAYVRRAGIEPRLRADDAFFWLHERSSL